MCIAWLVFLWRSWIVISANNFWIFVVISIFCSTRGFFIFLSTDRTLSDELSYQSSLSDWLFCPRACFFLFRANFCFSHLSSCYVPCRIMTFAPHPMHKILVRANKFLSLMSVDTESTQCFQINCEKEQTQTTYCMLIRSLVRPLPTWSVNDRHDLLSGDHRKWIVGRSRWSLTQHLPVIGSWGPDKWIYATVRCCSFLSFHLFSLTPCL